MKQSKLYFKTMKDVTNQAVAISHIYALKAGLIHQTGAGIYSYLPLARKMINNIENIIREELELIDANEVLLPLLEPSSLWEKTDRWNKYGAELFRVKDRKGNFFALAPTHEEVITDVVKNQLVSYKDYPVNLFQIGPKMRDELRPRFGLLRGREFIMMDGYSFHTSNEDLKSTYDNYYQAFSNIFDRLGLEYKVVSASNGEMGGDKSHEFMVLADIGEDIIVYEKNNSAAFNLEIAPIIISCQNIAASNKLLLQETVDVKSVNQVCDFFKISADKIIKSIVFEVNAKPVIVLIRGDREISIVKVEKCYPHATVRLASNEFMKVNKLIKGYIGPFDLLGDIEVIVDLELHNNDNFIIGANQIDRHYTGFNTNRDLDQFVTSDVRFITNGELMQKDGTPVLLAKTIEVGHIFTLGDKYSHDLGMKFLTKDQKKAIPLMGSYGIGVSRLISAIIEQSHDENGIIMPQSISPFDIHLIPLDYHKKETQKKFTDILYKLLKKEQFTVLLDDRDERPGVKFSDADLIGLPVQVIIGKQFDEDIIEIKNRKNGNKERIKLVNLIEKIKEELKC